MNLFIRMLIAFFWCCGFAVPALTSEQPRCQREGYSCADLVYRGFTYPYAREPGSYLYVNGGIYPYLSVTEDLVGDSTVLLPDGSAIAAGALLEKLGLNRVRQAQLRPVIGYGSNPAPSQLARKFSPDRIDGDVIIPVMNGSLKDYDVVWTPVFVSYGALPATVTPSVGTTVDVWVTWLDDRATRVMDETEHAETAEYPLYAIATLEGADFDFDGPDPARFSIYVSCFGALSVDGITYAVASVPARKRRFQPVSGPEAMKSVLPLLDGPGNVLELLFSNVTDPALRAARNEKIRKLGSLPEHIGASGRETCRKSRSAPPQAY